MGYSLISVPFFDVRIQVSEVVSASQRRLFDLEGKTLDEIGLGSLQRYDDRPGHYHYTFTDGEWFEFLEDIDNAESKEG